MEEPDIEFLRRLVDQRNRVQNILFGLCELVRRCKNELAKNERHNAIFQLLVGTTFSLWRAIVLAGKPFEPEPALEASRKLLNKVVSDNTIAFSDEKDARRWMSGFYVSNIQYRLGHLHQNFAEELDVPELNAMNVKWAPNSTGSMDDAAFFAEAIPCVEQLSKRICGLIESES